MARVSDALLHGGGDARHSWPGSTLARNPTQVTQVSKVKPRDITPNLFEQVFSLNNIFSGGFV